VTTLAVPSKGRLRDAVLALLGEAGYNTGHLRGRGSRTVIEGIEFIEMRPRDAATWLATGRIDAAFISTDLVLEEDLSELESTPLGLARSDLVIASRDDDGRSSADDLVGAVVATHLPNATRRYLEEQGIDAQVVSMGGALEGVCAAGLADAIVDLRETGTSLRQNRLRVLAEIEACEALFVRADSGSPDLADIALRLQASLDAERHRYVMLHMPPGQIEALTGLFPGLAAPTVLPLAGRDDLVAVHLVVEASDFWIKLGDIRAIGGSGIVALPPDALLR
jgi:ATP phosphoribosyltransferase